MKELVELIAKALVDQPELVQVSVLDGRIHGLAVHTHGVVLAPAGHAEAQAQCRRPGETDHDPDRPVPGIGGGLDQADPGAPTSSTAMFGR